MLQAIATGGLSEKRNTPVIALNFKGCAWFDSQCLMDVCDVFQHLKRLRLDHCGMIDDSSLEYLAQYQQQEWDSGMVQFYTYQYLSEQGGGMYGDSGDSEGAMYASDYSDSIKKRAHSPIDGAVVQELRNFHGLSDRVLQEAYEAGISLSTQRQGESLLDSTFS
eukprot:TRINITY_DN87313_c0_g1_i1.p2 TRINITY_DN87313_c0_g1~~TRINITY_DN87313_c0_g1_i1.p2  ORF type:complete len:164 (+),score=27.04 TRINITY_DN87313_c0_g1_i1:276-767(+)